VGFRIVERHSEWLEWLIIQNTNAYEEGFSAVWDGLRNAYWKRKMAESEKPLESFLEADTVRTVYTHGHPNPELVSPDNWNMNLYFLARPNAKRVQLDFFYDYQRMSSFMRSGRRFCVGVSRIPSFFGGQDDIFFTPEGGEAYLRDLPKAEIHRLKSGHFAVEDCLPYITEKMLAFYERNQQVAARRR
jgi:hypothetical protein